MSLIKARNQDSLGEDLGLPSRLLFALRTKKSNSDFSAHIIRTSKKRSSLKSHPFETILTYLASIRNITYNSRKQDAVYHLSPIHIAGGGRRGVITYAIGHSLLQGAGVSYVGCGVNVYTHTILLSKLVC